MLLGKFLEHRGACLLDRVASGKNENHRDGEQEKHKKGTKEDSVLSDPSRWVAISAMSIQTSLPCVPISSKCPSASTFPSPHPQTPYQVPPTGVEIDRRRALSAGSATRGADRREQLGKTQPTRPTTRRKQRCIEQVVVGGPKFA